MSTNYDFFSSLDLLGFENKIAYHYTNPEAIPLIVRPNRLLLRFSRADCLNDYSEGIDVTNMYQNVVSAMYKSGEINEDTLNTIIGIQPDAFNNASIWNEKKKEFDIQGIEFDAYLCAFSKKKDSLPMWNYYIRNDQYNGFSLGIETSQLNKSGRHWRIKCVPIIYNSDDKERLLRKLVLDANKIYSSPQDPIGLVERTVAETLTAYQYQFKDAHYQHEEEIRAILYFPKEPVPSPSRESSDYPRIDYRAKNGILIPYIDIEIEREALKEVVIAPTLSTRFFTTNSEKTIEYRMAEEFVMRQGYKGVEITTSSIAARY